MTAYYNEIDPDAVAILRQLIADDVIAPGDVDDRSIKDVCADDLRGYTQCHFFAGGGLWSVAARLAGWPDERPLWTGSCPCQPFSAAGRGLGADDPRHLWPDFHRLIRAGRPAVVMGEQVAGKAGYGWFDGVRADLAREGYACRGADIPACAVDAPHQRNRLWWCAVADADTPRLHAGGWNEASGASREDQGPRDQRQRLRADDRELDDALDEWLITGNRSALEHAAGLGRGEGRPEHELRSGWSTSSVADAPSPLGHPSGERLSTPEREAVLRAGWREPRGAIEQPDGAPARRNGSWWADAEWIACHDGKARRTKPGTPMLVDGLPGRVGLWRVAGNAVSPILAAEVIAAFMEAA